VSTSNDWTQVTLLGLLVLAAAGNVACAPRGEPAAAPSRAVAVVVVEPERPDAAPAEASLDTIEACIDALQSEDRQRRELGERCLRDRSTEALEPLRNASRQHQDGSVRRRADALWRALLDESARQLLAARQVTLLTDPDGAPDWKLMAASDVLPYLRYYKYWDRYPRGVLLDLLEGSEVQRPDEVEYQQLLSRLSPPPLDRASAGEYVKLYVQLQNEPYSADHLEVSVAQQGDVFEVSTTYQRTTVWSPPDRPTVAGSKTVQYEERWEVTPEGEITARGTRGTVVRVSP
jgi:hypothetical protein